MKPDGTKQRTKVFAGGAVIAEQADDWWGTRVEWISADPVTGSSVNIKKTGAFYDDERKELEALGQEVLPTEPFVEQPDAPAGVPINTADEPEWLCSMHSRNGTDFFELPVQCQISQLQSGVDLRELLSSKTENNPHHIREGEGGRRPNRTADGMPSLDALSLT